MGVYPGSELSDLPESVHPKISDTYIYLLHLPACEVCNPFVGSCYRIGGICCGLGCISQIRSLICLCVYVTYKCVISLDVFVKDRRSVLYVVICPSL